jgi:16S rRNA (guanine966-N2)-methyltransferase
MRITGGAFRSRALRAPRGQATRPTSDRVREALFGILSSAGALDGVRVLDLYAGTGALALEALSRGASDATLVEAAREALDAIRANVKSLAVEDRVRVVAGDVREAVRRLRGPFDLVLADPPWTLVEEGEAPRALAERGLVVLEHASRSPSPTIEQLAERSTRRYGDTSLTFYERRPLREPRRKS